MPFPPNVERTMTLYLCKMDPDVPGDGGHSIGLFQHNDGGLASGRSLEALQDPAANVRLAAQAVYGGQGWRPWGEGATYQGQAFGALGRNPYPATGGRGATPPPPTPGGTGMNREQIAQQQFGKSYADLTIRQQIDVDERFTAQAPAPGTPATPSAGLTTTYLGADGRQHRYQYNQQSDRYDIDLGPATEADTAARAQGAVTTDSLLDAGGKIVNPGIIQMPNGQRYNQNADKTWGVSGTPAAGQGTNIIRSTAGAPTPTQPGFNQPAPETKIKEGEQVTAPGIFTGLGRDIGLRTVAGGQAPNELTFRPELSGNGQSSFTGNLDQGPTGLPTSAGSTTSTSPVANPVGALIKPGDQGNNIDVALGYQGLLANAARNPALNVVDLPSIQAREAQGYAPKGAYKSALADMNRNVGGPLSALDLAMLPEIEQYTTPPQPRFGNMATGGSVLAGADEYNPPQPTANVLPPGVQRNDPEGNPIYPRDETSNIYSRRDPFASGANANGTPFQWGASDLAATGDRNSPPQLSAFKRLSVNELNQLEAAGEAEAARRRRYNLGPLTASNTPFPFWGSRSPAPVASGEAQPGAPNLGAQGLPQWVIDLLGGRSMAGGGSFMTQEPIVGMGAMSGQPQFIAGEAGPEQIDVTPTMPAAPPMTPFAQLVESLLGSGKKKGRTMQPKAAGAGGY